MAIPSEYNDHEMYVGATNRSNHQVVGFYPHLVRRQEETIGPLTNQKTGTVLHPDMHDSDPDRGRVNAAQHDAQISTFLPGLSAGENIVRKGNLPIIDQVAYAYGEAGVYIDQNYGEIANAPLHTDNLA